MDFFKKNIYKIIIFLILALGVFVRTFAFMQGREFDPDECHLYMNIVRSNNYFTDLIHAQMAPPVFLYITKFFTLLFGQAEKVYRLFPYILSVINVFLFCIFSKTFLKSKIANICANFLFAVNISLIFYAQSFKQYQLEVFVVMCAILVFNKVELFNLKNIGNYGITFKEGAKLFLYGVLAFIPMLMAIPYSFVFLAFLLKNFMPNKGVIIRMLLFVFPFSVLSLIYYKFSLLNLRQGLLEEFPVYWSSGFLSFNIKYFINLIKSNYTYLFDPNIIEISSIVLITCGLYIVYKHRKYLILLLVFLIPILASFVGVYPLRGRLILYELPVIIIFMNLLMDFCWSNKIVGNATTNAIRISTILLFFVANCHYFEYPRFISEYLFANYGQFSISTFPYLHSREYIHKLMKVYKPGDLVFINWFSEGPLVYYKNLYYPDKKVEYYILEDVRIFKKYKNINQNNRNVILYFPHTIYEERLNARTFSKNEVMLYENEGYSFLLKLNGDLSDIMPKILLGAYYTRVNNVSRFLELKSI